MRFSSSLYHLCSIAQYFVGSKFFDGIRKRMLLDRGRCEAVDGRVTSKMR